MDFIRGRVVLSKAGRDKGKFLAIESVDGDYVIVVDGGERPVDNPKRKNKRHLALTKTVLPGDSLSTNRGLRKALREFNSPGDAREGGN